MPRENSLLKYKTDMANWITLSTGEYYPDILVEAKELYKPVLITFGQILKRAESSEALFMMISEVADGWMRVQLSRIFRKYASPETPVEMLKKKSQAVEICKQFGKGFRKVAEVQRAFAGRPIPDEALCAVLWEYKDRGKKGYDLTEKFFNLFRKQFPKLEIIGPERAGKDIFLGDIFKNYSNKSRPVDFVIFKNKVPLIVGLARYDSDRGGAQEDDRTGGYKHCANEILGFSKKMKLNLKVLFINDGPGLLLGSMWNDYVALEASGKGKILVCTLRMIPERLTKNWLFSEA